MRHTCRCGVIEQVDVGALISHLNEDGTTEIVLSGTCYYCGQSYFKRLQTPIEIK